MEGIGEGSVTVDYDSLTFVLFAKTFLYLFQFESRALLRTYVED